MKKNKNLHSLSILPYITKTLTFISKEILNTIRYTFIALFKIFDFIMTNLITILTYVIIGLLYVFSYIGKFTVSLGNFVYNYLLKNIIVFLYNFILAFYKGLVRVLKFIFYEIPLFLFNSFSDFFDLISKKLKRSKERTTTFVRSTPTVIKEYFLKKINNLSIVKYYKNKKERELEVLFIDKFGKDAERSEKKQTYKYLARNSSGKLIKGYFAALSKLDVHSYLIDNGYIVYDIKTSWWINFTHGESKLNNIKMKNKDLVFYLAQLSTYLKAGIPLTEAVKILAEQDKRKKYKKAYDKIIYELSMGESFSESLKKQGNMFPALLINMVKAAELIGDLETTLDEMSEYYNEKETTKKQMIGALTYPTVILIFAVAVTTFLLVYIVPEFAEVYQSIGATLNPMTAFLLNTSYWLKDNAILLIILIILFNIALVVLYKKVKAFRTLVQYILMHIPVIGKLIIYNEMNLFAKTFSMLNKNNILLTDSMDILSKITNNEFYKMIIYDTISNLLRGEKISLSFKDNWCIPRLAYYMITTGESTGELSEMLDKVSEYYQREQRSIAATLKTLIEPVLMVLLAVIIGGIMVLILVPMYDIGKEIM